NNAQLTQHNEDVLQVSDDERDLTGDNGATFIPTGEMEKLPTKIYKDNKLPPETRQKILQMFPRNTLIKFTPPPMDKELLRKMQKKAKDTDKILQKVSYCTSSALRLFDCSIRALYQTKPSEENKQALEAWEYMELSLLSTRSLLLDSLSYISKHRQEQAIKCINPAYQTKSEVETLFDDRLTEVIKAEMRRQNFSTTHYGRKNAHKTFKLVTKIEGFNRTQATKEIINVEDRTCVAKSTTMEENYKFSPDRFSLSTAPNGYSPSWIEPPPLKRQALSRQNISSQDMEILDVEIKKLLVQGTITEIFLSEPCFTSRLFLIPKRTGEARPVIDLRKLNTYKEHISSRTSGVQFTGLFRLRLSQYTLCIYGIALWSDDKSSNIHKNSETGNRRKVTTGAVTNNRISRIQHRLSKDDIYDSNKEGKRHLKRMQKGKGHAHDSGTQISSAFRETERHHRSNFSSKTIFESPTQRHECSNEETGLKRNGPVVRRKQATAG
ncbi:26900_t:CDS:2, partial [Gigaspora margarita]